MGRLACAISEIGANTQPLNAWLPGSRAFLFLEGTSGGSKALSGWLLKRNPRDPSYFDGGLACVYHLSGHSFLHLLQQS